MVHDKNRKCAYCGKVDPLSTGWEIKVINGDKSYRHKNCTFKSRI